MFKMSDILKPCDGLFAVSAISLGKMTLMILRLRISSEE